MSSQEKVKEQLEALRIADSCMLSVLSINPDAFDLKTLAVIAQLKMELMKALDI